jgi:hypothetical protein
LPLGGFGSVICATTCLIDPWARQQKGQRRHHAPAQSDHGCRRTAQTKCPQPGQAEPVASCGTDLDQSSILWPVRGLRDLIQRMSSENPKWGASRIHGEMLMLGFEVAQSTVPDTWCRAGLGRKAGKRSFRNHAQAIAAIDLFVVPTLTFGRLFAFLVLGHSRRQLLWFEVTRHPTAEWLARQITEAFPWASAPAYLVRDNDRAYGHIFTSRGQGDGHSRSTDLARIAVAKSVCRASDWHRASRVPGPDSGFWRSAFAANSFSLCSVLQSHAHASGLG